jgi:hypothetical protein
MKTLATKIVLATSVALATLMAVETASARPQRHQAVPEAYSGFGEDSHGAVQSDDVVEDGKVIGRDPDPFIRSQMKRGYGLSPGGY